MKKVIKIILTNWVSVVVIFATVFVAGFISAIVEDKFNFNEAISGTLYAVIGYGMSFWIGFIILIVLLDILLFSFNQQPSYTVKKLIVESFLISSPFVYWLLQYKQWIFLTAIAGFLIGQVLRKFRITKILR